MNKKFVISMKKYVFLRKNIGYGRLHAALLLNFKKRAYRDYRVLILGTVIHCKFATLSLRIRLDYLILSPTNTRT